MQLEVQDNYELYQKEFDRVMQIRAFRDDELDRVEEYVRCRVEVALLRLAISKEGQVFVSERSGGSYLNPRVNLLINTQARMDKIRDKLFSPVPKGLDEAKDIRDEFF